MEDVKNTESPGTELAAVETATQIAAVQPKTGIANIWSDKDAFNQTLRAAQMLAQTSIIPAAYQGKPQDCFVALEMATRMNVSPIVVMQNMCVVKGKPSWSGQACTMLINACGKFRNVAPVYFGTEGADDRGCYLSAIRVSDGAVVNGTKVTMQMAKAEGWTSNPKWRNMPEQMLAYRAAAFFARIHCPDALMGVHTSDEVYETVDRVSPGQRLTEALSEVLPDA